MRILLVDNFDSFSFNLVHYFEQLDVEVCVETNLSVDLNKIETFDAVVLSPGPGLPKEAGKLMEVIAEAIQLNIPILGVCLGMQAIALHFEDELYNQKILKHGCAERLEVTQPGKLFANLPTEFSVGLYHSWAVQLKPNSPLIATSFSESGVLMSVEHKSLPIYAVQFHPESILSEYGLEVLSNFLKFSIEFIN